MDRGSHLLWPKGIERSGTVAPQVVVILEELPKPTKISKKVELKKLARAQFCLELQIKQSNRI